MPAAVFSQTTDPTLRCCRQQRPHINTNSAHRAVRKDTNRPPALSATTSTPCPHARVMHTTNRHPNYQGEQQNTDLSRGYGSCAPKTSVANTTVLIIAGIPTDAVSRGLTHAAALSSPNGITLNVFDSLDHLPCYRETRETQRLPRPVAALRNAAIEAHATIVLTHYYGHIPATVHNAIDWLTRRWNHSALHDKPLAVIGPTEGGYGGGRAPH